MRVPLSRVHRRLNLTHGFMVVTALLTFIAVSSALRDRSATVPILVADARIERGSLLGSDDLVLVEIPAADPLVGSFFTRDSFSSGRATRAIEAGEPLLQSDVQPASAHPGARTFTIPVGDGVIVGLGLSVGDRIDVVGVDVRGELGFVAVGLLVVRLPASPPATGLGGSFGPSFVTIEANEQEILRLVAAHRVDDLSLVRSTGAPASEVTP